MGLMYFWNMSIDTVTMTNIIISVGLCVDYSAHIAHTFLTKTGAGNERMQQTLTEVGPAVFNGGFSTFLAFILLAGSRSHVFSTFFKVKAFNFPLYVLTLTFSGFLLSRTFWPLQWSFCITSNT